MTLNIQFTVILDDVVVKDSNASRSEAGWRIWPALGRQVGNWATGLVRATGLATGSADARAACHPKGGLMPDACVVCPPKGGLIGLI